MSEINFWAQFSQQNFNHVLFTCYEIEPAKSYAMWCYVEFWKLRIIGKLSWYTNGTVSIIRWLSRGCFKSDCTLDCSKKSNVDFLIGLRANMRKDHEKIRLWWSKTYSECRKCSRSQHFMSIRCPMLYVKEEPDHQFLIFISTHSNWFTS